MLDKNKDAALKTAISQLEKKYGVGTLMRLGDKPHQVVDVIPTGALNLDIALGIGGIPKGRITEIYGAEASGKTTLALHIAAECQKQGGIVAFIDVEHALDPIYAMTFCFLNPMEVNRHWKLLKLLFAVLQLI